MISEIIDKANKINLETLSSQENTRQTFKLIEAITRNNLQHLSKEGFSMIIQMNTRFSLQKEDPYISLATIETFYMIARNLSNIKATDSEMIKLWSDILRALKTLCCDERIEIRNKSFKMLQEIFKRKAACIPLGIWRNFFFEICPELLQFSEALRKTQRDGVNEVEQMPLNTPTFSSVNNPPEEQKEEPNKEDIQTRREAHKSWEESIVPIISTFGCLLKLFHNNFPKNYEIRQKAWSQLLNDCVILIRTRTYSIVEMYLSIITKLAPSFQDLESISNLKDILKELRAWFIAAYERDPYNTAPIGSRLAPSIVEMLKATLNHSINKLDLKEIENLCEFIREVLMCSQVLGKFPRVSIFHRLMVEENLLFNYIDELANILCKDEQGAVYLKFLLNFLDYKPNDPHNNVFIRRVLIILKKHIAQYKFSVNILKEVLETLYSKLMYLVNLRYGNVRCEPILCCNKNVIPLWYEAGISIIYISGFFITTNGYIPKHLRPLCKCSSVNFHLFPCDIIEDKEAIARKEENRKKMLEDKDFQELAWNITLKNFREILLIKEAKVAAIDKSLATEVSTKLQDLGIALVDFLTKSLLLNNTSTERHKDLVNLVDIGSSILEETLKVNIINETDEMSKHCLEMVLEMYDTYNEKPEFMEVMKKVARFTTPVLINRCKGMIKTFLTEEKFNGLIPLPKYKFNIINRNKAQDLIYLLDKLMKVKIDRTKQEEYDEIYETGKGHLILIMPELVECIGTKEIELRNKVKEILLEISDILIGPEI